jgi:hypothetical protein
LMTSPHGFSGERKRNRAGTDRSEPHDVAPLALENSKKKHGPEPWPE